MNVCDAVCNMPMGVAGIAACTACRERENFQNNLVNNRVNNRVNGGINNRVNGGVNNGVNGGVNNGLNGLNDINKPMTWQQLIYQLISVVIQLYALYLLFKCNKRPNFSEFLVACGCSICYIPYRWAIPCK